MIEKKGPFYKYITPGEIYHAGLLHRQEKGKSRKCIQCTITKKGGVGVVDSLSKSHSTRIKSKRWHLNALAFIPNTCRSNAKTILGDKSIKSTNSHFTYNLRKALVLPSTEKRYRDLNGLQIRIINKMQRVPGIKEASRKPEVENAQTKSDRCFKCVEGIAGTSTYMIERENLNNNLKFKCRKCNNFIWKKHQHQIKYICEDCKEWKMHFLGT